MERKTLNDFGISSPELDTRISLRDAYLSMVEFLQTHWQGCGDEPLGSVLGMLSLWDNTRGDKAPMDGAVLPDWLESARRVQEAQKTEAGYRGADIQWQK